MQPTFVFRKPKNCELIIIPPSKVPVIPPGTIGTLVLRLTVNGVRGTRSTGVKVRYQDWDADAQKIRGKSERVRLDNDRLQDIRNDATRHYYDLERAGQHVSAKRLKKLIEGDGSAEAETLLVSWGKWHQHQLRRAKAGEILVDTANLPQRRRPILLQWLTETNREDLLTSELSQAIAKDFRRWLLTDYGKVKSQAHANRTARLLSECASCALERGVLAYHPIPKLKLPKVTKKQLIYLTDDQLQLVRTKPLPTAELRRTRDAFLLMCYTGFAWVDARKFDPTTHIETDKDGQRWLHRPRQKTEREAVIPLLPDAELLLRKYAFFGRVPVPANQLMNRRLKSIAELLDLPINLTCHVGRRTFGMVALNAGVSIESVSAMLGHASIRITEDLYAKVKERRIGREMRDAGLLHPKEPDEPDSE